MILILMALYIVLNTFFFPINVRVPLPRDLLALKINGKVYSNWIMPSLPGFLFSARSITTYILLTPVFTQRCTRVLI